MINFVKVISTEIKKAQRVIKILRLGLSDVQTAEESVPFGIDSAVPKDFIAIYAPTSAKGTVIIGYLNKNQLAETGEMRIYSTNSAGNEVKMYIHLKTDGTAVFGGEADNLVRFTPVDDAIKDIKAFLQQELPLIAAGIATGGGSYTPGTPTFDVADAKIEEFKTL